MKPSLALLALTPLSLAANINLSGGCPGDTWNNICCIGRVDGPAVSAHSSSISGLHRSLSAAATSRKAALSSRLASVTRSENAGITNAPAMKRALNALEKRDTSEIESGVTCYGSAVSISDSDFGAKVAAATSKSKEQGAAFTSGGDAQNTESGSVMSASSDGVAPRMTGAAVLVGGMAGAMIYGAM